MSHVTQEVYRNTCLIWPELKLHAAALFADDFSASDEICGEKAQEHLNYNNSPRYTHCHRRNDFHDSCRGCGLHHQATNRCSAHRYQRMAATA